MKEFVEETEHGNLYVDTTGIHAEYTLVSNFSGREYASCRHGYTKDIKDGGGVVTFTDGISGIKKSYCMLCVLDLLSSKIPEL